MPSSLIFALKAWLPPALLSLGQPHTAEAEGEVWDAVVAVVAIGSSVL
jgi:hypothetical protein